MSYFGNSVPKIYKTQEDYKPVLFCVHCNQIPIYTAAMPVCVQLLIIFTLLHNNVKDWTKDTFTPHSLLLQFCASFMPRLANAGDMDIPNLWVISTDVFEPSK